MQLHLAVLVLAVVCGIHAQTPGEGKCPTPPVKKDFDASKYIGRWYEVQRTDLVLFELDCKCVQATYSALTNGKIGVENKCYNTILNETITISGDAYAPDPKEPAKLLVNLGGGSGPGAPYWVLDTDYHTYTLVYSCSPVPLVDNTFADIVWILGRTRTLPDDLIKKLKDYVASLNIRSDVIVATDQSNCD